MTKESTTLYYREGSSDKVYQATIEEAKGGFVVNFAFGRRGNTLSTGTKTAMPVPLTKAKSVFDKLVQSKLAKGYTPGEAGTPYTHTSNADRDTGVRPQLCNPIENDEATAELLTDNEYWMEEKLDGKRVLVRKDAQGIVGINRQGLLVALPEPVAKAAAAYDERFILDGECIGDTLHVFDLLALGGESLLTRPLRVRRNKLEQLLLIDDPHLVIVESFRTTIAKSQQYVTLRKGQMEGVVFKHPDAPYAPGRPASGGTWLKFKFTTTGSFIVCRVNADRRSVGLEVRDGRRGIEIGNVTIPVNAAVPKPGAIVEIRYLYAFKGGSLYQPVYLGQRDDLTPNDCTVRQLKFKAGDSDEAS
ncbi:MAG: DNA ligase [Verrucomicrobiae bacterium]|nr:DNA ligase [Verrucomicrobiae bacterium]